MKIPYNVTFPNVPVAKFHLLNVHKVKGCNIMGL